jgi:lipopolysaccharide export system permease protein
VKILDKYLLKTFLTTFTMVFVILFFIFILQSVWLFIAELAGKDLDLVMVLKFLLFAMPRIVPLVLPLSVLLASIMTFGNLAENYEFAAMKSAGISLQRAMKSLIIFISLLSFVAFMFANNVIPYAEYKFINFRRNIAQLKPAMAIAEGQFSDVGLFNIKVNKKSGKDGNTLTGITIHKKSPLGDGNKTVIKAKNGKLISSEKSSTLHLVLNEGNYYEDVAIHHQYRLI